MEVTPIFWLIVIVGAVGLWIIFTIGMVGYLKRLNKERKRHRYDR